MKSLFLGLSKVNLRVILSLTFLDAKTNAEISLSLFLSLELLNFILYRV